ncbi:ATP-binding cassette domain-containing protein [Porphyrobacter sp. AAP60]|uniref:ATP-binding cassette domain-containing protein n=1 Tax=Porphyrobacter sp. AAP60 TaxID=1523423 RepID=UPI0006B8AE8D|nr:ABC transporter ATP-binding protein [Porphyrobacter sp. AAP60]KPF61832.1 hypothetical protein IP79_14570 [Porphyrobacter sp. AAP60]
MAHDDGGVIDLIKAIVRYAGNRLWPTVAIVVVAAVLEGAGIVLLLPVAETIFSQSGEPAQTGVTATILALMRDVGIDTVLEQLAIMSGGFIMLVLARSVVLVRRDVLLSHLSQGFVDHERLRFFRMLTAAEWPVIKRFGKSQLLNSIVTNIGRLGQTMNFLTRGLVTAALGMASVAAAFLVSTTLGVFLLALTAVSILLALAWARRSHASGERLTLANRGMMQETMRFLDGLKAAKAVRAEEELAERFESRISEARSIQVAFVRQQARLRNGVQLLAAFAALAVLLLSYGWLGLSGGELLVMAAIILRLAPALVTTFSGVQSLAHALPAFTALREVEADLVAAGSDPDPDSDAEVAFDRKLANEAPIILRDCSVKTRDPTGEQVTLVEIDYLIIPPGTLVHISGPSGSGKSTLAELLAGLHLPSTGEIERGPVTLSQRRAWQSQVSFAPQEPFLFSGTVRENLCWPQGNPEESSIWQALDIAQAAHLVRGLQSRLDEELLDHGARLSGGERQRLCIARALLQPASLLILDEATSAMEPELERAIVSSIKHSIGQRIVMIVSHSRENLDLADIRVTVADGKAVIEEGSAC